MNDEEDNDTSAPVADDAAPAEQPAHKEEEHKVTPPPAQSNDAANPTDRLSAELLALFDAKGEPGELKSQAAAIIRSLLDLKGPAADGPSKPAGDEPVSQRVDARFAFLPTRPKVDFTRAAGPTSSYDALKKPGR